MVAHSFARSPLETECVCGPIETGHVGDQGHFLIPGVSGSRVPALVGVLLGQGVDGKKVQSLPWL